MTGKKEAVVSIGKNGAVIIDFNGGKTGRRKNVRNTDNVPARNFSAQRSDNGSQEEPEAEKNGSYPRFDMNEVSALYHSEDREKRAKAIEMTYLRYRKYVVSLARGYFGSFFDRGEHFVSKEDFLSAGHLGLIDALDVYDPRKGAFTTWCKPFVLGRMSEQARIVIGIPSEHYAGILKKVNRAVDAFRRLNIEPTVEMLAEETKLSRSQVLDAIDLGKKVIAVGAGGCGYYSGEASRAMREAEIRAMEEYPSSETPEDIVLKREFKLRMDNVIGKKLEVREGEALRLKFGFYDNIPEKGLSMPKLAERLGVSTSNARYIVEKALKSLRDDDEVMDLAGKLLSGEKKEAYPLDSVLPVFTEKSRKPVVETDPIGDELAGLFDLDPDTLLA